MGLIHTWFQVKPQFPLLKSLEEYFLTALPDMKGPGFKWFNQSHYSFARFCFLCGFCHWTYSFEATKTPLNKGDVTYFWAPITLLSYITVHWLQTTNWLINKLSAIRGELLCFYIPILFYIGSLACKRSWRLKRSNSTSTAAPPLAY